MGSVTQQEAPPIGQAFDHALMHLERRYPAEIGQPHIDTDPGIEQSAQVGCCRKPMPRIGIVAIDKDEPAVIRQRREQDKSGRPHDKAPTFRRTGQADLASATK